MLYYIILYYFWRVLSCLFLLYYNILLSEGPALIFIILYHIIIGALPFHILRNLFCKCRLLTEHILPFFVFSCVSFFFWRFRTRTSVVVLDKDGYVHQRRRAGYLGSYRCSHPDLSRAPYVLYGVKYIDPLPFALM